MSVIRRWNNSGRNMVLGRRRLAQMLGAGAVASALTPMLRALAEGEDGQSPKRIVFITSFNGVPTPDPGHRDYRPGLPEEFWPSGSALEFGRILEPLAAHRDDVLLAGGLDIKSSVSGSGPHTAGPALYSNQRNGATSIDQRIADQIAEAGMRRTLHLGVRVRNGRSGVHLSGGNAMQVVEDPSELFDSLFSGVMPGGDADHEAWLARQARRRTILERSKADIEDVRGGLSPASQDLLDHHLQLIRDIETELESGGEAPLGCARPEVDLDEFNATSTQQIPRTARLHLDLTRAAFACDLCRVVTLEWSHRVSPQEYPFLTLPDGSSFPGAQGGGRDHHIYSHQLHTVGQAPLIEINRFFFENLEYLVSQLKATVQPNGRSLFDDTLIVVSNPLGRGIRHVTRDIPVVIVGGGWHFGLGQFHRFGGDSHGKMLVEVCRAMGLAVDKVGNDDSTGGLPDVAIG